MWSPIRLQNYESVVTEYFRYQLIFGTFQTKREKAHTHTHARTQNKHI